MIGNEEDFTASLGFEVKGADEHLSHIETDAFKAMIDTAVGEFPNFKVAATTLRRVITATVNDWSAILLARRQILREPSVSRPRDPRPRRRRRQLRERPHVRFPIEERRAARGGLRRRARRSRLDDSGRHLDGDAEGSREIDEGRQRARGALTYPKKHYNIPAQPGRGAPARVGAPLRDEAAFVVEDVSTGDCIRTSKRSDPSASFLFRAICIRLDAIRG